MKYLKKLSVRHIAIALVIGTLCAASWTDIAYPCDPPPERGGCTAYEDAISHPKDLLNNVQDSRSRFLGTFAFTSLVSLVAITIFTELRKKPRQQRD